VSGKRRNSSFWKKPKLQRKTGSRTPQKRREFVLEQGSLASLQAEKVRTKALLEYYWKFYSELAYQRNEKQEEILQALRQNCTAVFEFKNWQRAVKYKYCLHPFSTVGSLTDPGGRFNVGDVNPNVREFPALYVAADKDTALQEALGQFNTGSELTALERALVNPQSETIVSVSGKIDRVFDLRNPLPLKPFVEIIKHFTLSEPLLEIADSLGEERPILIQNVEQLHGSLLDPDWRVWPSRYDVPANSQVFGHFLYLAQIEGVVYPSKFTGKDCIALFPHHFQFSTSYVELDHEPPHPKVPRRIDTSTWKVCDQTSAEAIGDRV
jgi:RES domain-containing protein